MDAERHAAALWQAVKGHDELWTWLFDGPYASEADLRQAIEARQAAAGFVFLAIVPVATGQAAGWASFMRMERRTGSLRWATFCFRRLCSAPPQPRRPCS